MKVEDLEIPSRIKKKYLSSGIKKLNPPQKKAVENGLMADEDLIIASPTASGKTFIAELGIVNQVVKNRKKAVYIVPLKALASEKYDDFSERYEELNVMMSVGDKDESGDYLENADIVIVTSEKLDSMLRHNPSWIHDIGLVITDEIHLLTSPNRGPTLEITLTRLRDILDFQMLGLSATISNSNELADWLDATLVESDYRPVELEEGIIHGNEIKFYPEDYQPEQEEEKNDSPTSFKTGSEIRSKKTPENSDKAIIKDGHGKPTLNILEDTINKEKQCIIFCNSRKGSEKSSDRCGEVSEEDLDREEELKLEEYAEIIENTLGTPTSQCKRLAENVRKGAAFHHAGLCLSGDSLILHADGSFSRMENLVKNSKETAIGLSEHKMVECNIKEKYELDEKPILKIKTNKGRVIKVSKNHRLPILGEEGIIWRKSKNLNEEDRVATPRKIDIDTKIPDLREMLRENVRTYRKHEELENLVKDLDTNKIEGFSTRYTIDRNITVGDLRTICNRKNESASKYLNTVMSKGGRKPVDIPARLDKDISWAIGAVAGDGYIDNHSVVLTGSCEEIINRFQKICSEKFSRKVSSSERDDGVRTVALNAKVVADILKDFFGIPEGEKAKNLRMPEVGLPNELLASYIRGLFDTDGSVNCRDNADGSPCIEFYTASKELATELHTSLLRFGITAYRDKKKTESRITKLGERQINTNGDIHRLTIYGSEQLREYRDTIGFTHPKKKSRLDEAIKNNPNGGRNQNDIIPKPIGTKVRKIRGSKNLSLSDLEPEIPKSTLSRFENHKTPIKRKTFQKLAKKLEDKELQKIANSDIYWEKITEIKEKEPEKLYDISTSTENFIANGVIAHNTTEQRKAVEKGFKEGFIRSVSATPTLAAGVNLPAYRVIMRDLKRYTGRGMEYIPVLEYEQMSGRAGRPKYDNTGQAISVAKSPGMTDEVLDRYILGEPERIQSKLAAEPVLRMHTLALVASKFCTSMDGLLSFYRKTFYAYQYGDMSQVESKIEKVVRQLQKYGFLEETGLEATKIGKRVSELYIDPDSANLIIESLQEAEEKDVKPISYLFMLSRTTEMQPRPRVRDKEASDIEEALFDAEKYLLEELPKEWSTDYEHFLECMKNSLMMQAWISEVDEERIMDKYNVAPGGIRAKMQNADWLVYGSQELARMKDIDIGKDLEKLRLRLKHGISEELLSLIKYDQIGRVRARKLYDHGIRDRETIRETGFEKLKRLIGEKTARKLKKQVGQENIFDRENIMDYFD